MNLLPRNIRLRTTLLIAFSFFLFLSIFFGATYYSIEDSLLERSEFEVMEHLREVAPSVHSGMTPAEFTRISAGHNRTGESLLYYLILERTAQGYQRLYPSTFDSTFTPNSVVAELETHPREVFRYRSNGAIYHLMGLQYGNFIVAASINNLFIEEARESIVVNFSISLFAGLLVALVIGYIVSNYTLSPITLLIDAAKTISKQSLNTSARLPVPQKTHEVAELARTINLLLEERERFVEQLQSFTADAAHELRTPLTVLKGEIEVELRLLAKDSSYAELLCSNLEEVERLIDIVQDLLYLATLDEEQQRTSAQRKEDTCSIQSMIVIACDRLATLAKQKCIDVHHEVEDIFVLANEERLIRLFYNLLLNAIQYSHQNSTIDIRSVQTDHGYTVSITDHGIGIAEEDLELIFNRFYRAEKSRSRSSGGSGLGLAIARSIAEKYNLELSLQSIPGKGTTAQIVIPNEVVTEAAL